MVIVRESSHIGPCNILGALVRETVTRYIYRRRRDLIAFVSKRSPKIHLEPCQDCPDHPREAREAIGQRVENEC